MDYTFIFNMIQINSLIQTPSHLLLQHINNLIIHKPVLVNTQLAIELLPIPVEPQLIYILLFTGCVVAEKLLKERWLFY